MPKRECKTKGCTNLISLMKYDYENDLGPKKCAVCRGVASKPKAGEVGNVGNKSTGASNRFSTDKIEGEK